MIANQDKEIIARFMEDDDFRAKVLKDPQGTLDAEGYTASAELIDKLANADAAAVQQAVDAQRSGAANATC